MKYLRLFNVLIIVALLLAGLTIPAFGQDPSPQEEPPTVTPEPPPPPTKEPPPFSFGTAPASVGFACVDCGIMAPWPGPDGYGYIGQTVTYNWVEISGSGTAVYLSDDNYDGPLPIGFTFNFYGTNWTQFYISSNGFISFGGGSYDLGNDCPLPNANTPDNLIALMWDDLDPGDTSDPVYYQSFSTCPIGSGACLVVQYENFHHFPGGGTIAGTFEAILFDNGNVIIQFQDAGAEGGSGSTTGIENADAVADYGLTYACDTPSSLSDNLAIWFGFPTGLYLSPSELEVTGCADITQTHTFNLMNFTGGDATFTLAYAVPSGNGTLSGPGSLFVADGSVEPFDVELTPDECLPEGTEVIATTEASGNGYNATSVITKTISYLGSWATVPSSAPPWAGNGYPIDGCSALNADGDWVTYLIGDQTFGSIAGFWGYHYATNTWWFQPGAANTPTDRWAPDWAYDPETNLCYLTGGATAPGPGNINEAWVYDPVANAFAPLPDFTTIRDFHDSWVGRIDGTKYLCIGGGVRSGDVEYVELASTQCYDLDTTPANWQAENATMGTYPTDIAAAADGILYTPSGDQFWTVAGMQGGGISDAAWYFDDADNSWHSAGNTGQARYRLEGDFKHGDFYQLGGLSSGFNYTPTAVRGRFNGTSWDWEQMDDLPTARMDNVVGVTVPEIPPVPPTIWVIDGYGSFGATDYVDYLIQCPPCEELGWLEGYVMDSELGDTEPPCTKAVVHIEPGDLDIPADPLTGYYGPVELISYSYTLKASAPGFSVETAVVDVTTGMTTTQDFDLWRPIIDVEPTNFISITAIISQETTYPLTITNGGHLPLNFQIREIPPGSLLSVAEPRSYQQMPAAVGVDSFIYEQFAASPDGRADFLIAFKDTADLTPAYHMNWSDRGRFVVKALQATADAAQGRVKAWLDEQGIEYTSYWINNTLFVHADKATLNALAALPEVSGFMGNHIYQVMPVEGEEEPQGEILTPQYPWNITFPGADQVHADFIRGEGIVIGGMDTGVEYDHIGLVNNYRGNLGGGSFDHIYSWFDPGTNDCGSNPCDTDGHGTATHGIMTGDDDPSLPDGAWIGMAPNAQWIHCLGLSYGSGSSTELLQCALWFLAPGGDPDMRPHVVNHSLGSSSPNDCDGNWYAPALQAYRAADIFPAFSAGNVGDWVSPPHCWSSTSPANNTDPHGNSLAFASGAHGADGLLDYYSSGGPSACNNDNLFPDLVAPGLGSCTTGLNDTYNCDFGGTSSASPHTAGCAALVRQAVPWLTVDEVEQILRDAAKDVDDGCGTPPESPDWNNKYGEGLLDCYEAVELAIQHYGLPWVWEDPITGTIPGPGEIEIDVTVHCTETHDYTGTLRIRHNDPCEGPVDVPIALHCQEPPPEPPWDKQVSINGVLTDTMPVTVVSSDTVEIVDRVWITYTGGVTFTLVETWTESLDLDGWENDAGSVISGTNTLTWDVTDEAPNTWYAITKTFHVEEGAWLYDYITETLWVENADPQPDDRVLQFNYLTPDIEVSPLSLSATLSPAGTITRTLAISNVGTANLTWSLTENPLVAWLSEAPNSGTVAPSHSTDVTVSFDATGLAEGNYTADLVISNNDPDENPVTVPVEMHVEAIVEELKIYLPIIMKNATP